MISGGSIAGNAAGKFGEVSERPKERAWKVRDRQKRFKGSNPFLSARNDKSTSHQRIVALRSSEKVQRSAERRYCRSSETQYQGTGNVQSPVYEAQSDAPIQSFRFIFLPGWRNWLDSKVLKTFVI